MNNVYEGIFVKSFVLFNGESINYYISEEKEDGESNTETARIVNNGINPYSSRGRYEAINDIIASRKEHDNETLKKLIHTYAVNECIIPVSYTHLDVYKRQRYTASIRDSRIISCLLWKTERLF